ncbi:cytochrome P450 [Syncephalis fuscata]|nr:cytochrome P450 [Syncephalis fuscata]
MITDLFFSTEGLLLLVGALCLYCFLAYEVYAPLGHVPGPWYTKLSSVWYNYKLATGTQVTTIRSLHEQYGPIVRLGHKVVAIADVNTVREIFNTHKYKKGPFYEGFHFANTDNLFSTTSVETFKERKRLMAPAFTLSAIDEMESIVQKSGINPLIRRLKSHADGKQVVNMHQMHYFFSFDAMSELSFGKSLNLLENNHHPCIDWMHSFLMLGVYKAGMGSLAHPKLVPHLYAAEKQMSDFAHEAIRRRKAESFRPDPLQRLMDAKDEETGKVLSEDELAAELIVMLVAGTDTTGASLTWVLYNLLESPKAMKKLQDELDATFPTLDTPITHESVKELPYLNAVLHESFRINPASAGDPQRVVPPEGTQLCGKSLPGGTILVPQIYALHHLEEYWPEHDKFKPERWLVDVEKVNVMKRAFIPFSYGVRSCIGRNLAWLELRLAAASMIRNFEFTFVPGANMTPKQQFIYTMTDRKLEVTIRQRNL